jgi:hypothetical protein
MLLNEPRASNPVWKSLHVTGRSRKYGTIVGAMCS